MSVFASIHRAVLVKGYPVWKLINSGLIQFHCVWLMFKFIVLITGALVVSTENAGSLFVL